MWIPLSKVVVIVVPVAYVGTEAQFFKVVKVSTSTRHDTKMISVSNTTNTNKKHLNRKISQSRSFGCCKKQDNTRKCLTLHFVVRDSKCRTYSMTSNLWNSSLLSMMPFNIYWYQNDGILHTRGYVCVTLYHTWCVLISLYVQARIEVRSEHSNTELST